MTYNHRTGVVAPNKKSMLFVVLPTLAILGGLYALLNVLSPALPIASADKPEAIAKKLTERQPASSDNRLYIPKIGVDVDVVQGVDEKSLDKGAWHRLPENGDPITGGNFVLAAHRFNLGFTPEQTRAKSPFYNIHSLQAGDDIYVDYEGVRYAYKVERSEKVDGSAVAIEQRTPNSQLTMYSCDLRGPEYGREVVYAKPVGTIAWLNGEPKLKVTQ